LEEDLSVVQYYASVLEKKLRESEDRYERLQDKFTLQKHEFGSQVAALVSKSEGALQQASSSIQRLEQKLQGLEDQKDQLEEDRFTAQIALQQLQSQHEQVTGDRLQSFICVCVWGGGGRGSVNLPTPSLLTPQPKYSLEFFIPCHPVLKPKIVILLLVAHV
jgi:hypothetical protein